MTPRQPPSDSDDEENLGAPIDALADIAQEARPGFLARVRRRIERRVLASQVLDMSWFTLVFVLLEYLDAIFRAVLGRRHPSTDKPDTGGPDT